jgi:hypothetical protein
VNGRRDQIARQTALAQDSAILILRCKNLLLSRENLTITRRPARRRVTGVGVRI